MAIQQNRDNAVIDKSNISQHRANSIVAKQKNKATSSYEICKSLGLGI